MRLIDADMLSERLKDLDDWCKDLRKPGIEQARCIVHDSPIVDAEVVRHAKWEYGELRMWCHCSLCGEQADAAGYDEPSESKYCPNCGAKMDL